MAALAVCSAWASGSCHDGSGTVCDLRQGVRQHDCVYFQENSCDMVTVCSQHSEAFVLQGHRDCDSVCAPRIVVM